MNGRERDDREGLRTTFDQAASAYRLGRPGYPAEVYSLLTDRCGLGVGCAVLEVGAGAGQATIPMLDLGAAVTAIEPGHALVRELLEQGAGRRLRVINATFEDATLPESAFDMVASATAFHWVDPAVRLSKSARLLRDGGWLAVWSNRYGDPTRPDPFHTAIQPLLREYAPELLLRSCQTDSTNAQGYRGLPSSQDFDAAELHELRWEGRHDPRELRALFSTFSPWIALPIERRETLLDAMEALARDQFGGIVTRPYVTAIDLRRRRAR